eukprot:s5463_g1.t1
MKRVRRDFCRSMSKLKGHGPMCPLACRMRSLQRRKHDAPLWPTTHVVYVEMPAVLLEDRLVDVVWQWHSPLNSGSTDTLFGSGKITE